MNGFRSIYLSPLLPMALGLLAGVVCGFRWLARGERPGIRAALWCALPAGLLAYLGFLITGVTLVRPGLFTGLLVAVGLAANLLAVAIASRPDRLRAWQTAALGVLIAALPALAAVLPNGMHRVLHWNPSFWLALGWIRAHADDATLEAMALRFPAHFEASYAVAPIVLCAGLAWYLRKRADERI